MTQVSGNQAKDLLVVASNGCRERLTRALGRSADEAVWCTNGYEAVATAIELHRQHRSVLACILVDYLTTQEMRLFACLTQMSDVTTIALSAIGSHKKLTEAKALGANQTIILGKSNILSELLGARDAFTADAAPAEPLSEQPFSQEDESAQQKQLVSASPTNGSSPGAKSVEASIANLAAQVIASAEKTHTEDREIESDSVKTPSIKTKFEEPLLSKEELDALLG